MSKTSLSTRPLAVEVRGIHKVVRNRIRKLHTAVTTVDFLTSFYTLPTKVKMRGVPPTRALEGFDLSHYHFQAGRVYDVPSRLAEVLVLWGYAELEMRRQPRAEAAD